MLISKKNPALLILLSGFLLPVVGHASDQIEMPFGVKLGENRAELKKYALDKIKNSGFQHILISPPRPSQLFSLYSVFYTQETGVCAILSTATNIKSDSNAKDLIKEYNEINKILSSKYGEATKQTNTIDLKSNYNLYKLSKNEAEVESYWKLNGEISQMILSATSQDGDTGKINLFYYGKQINRCIEIRNNDLAKNL